MALAAELIKSNIKVTIITEAQAVHHMKMSDIMLVGADSISSSYIMNKVGTYSLALAAKEFKKPSYVITDKSKITSGEILRLCGVISDDIVSKPEEKEISEITDLWKNLNFDIAKINISNIYFEMVPLNYFTGIISDSGLLDVEGIVEMIRRKKLIYNSVLEIS